LKCYIKTGHHLAQFTLEDLDAIIEVDLHTVGREQQV
jgi:hypothetical protein